jgi:hypothetical protein
MRLEPTYPLACGTHRDNWRPCLEHRITLDIFKIVHNTLTGVTLTVATVFVAEPGVDRKGVANEGRSLNRPVNESSLEHSRWNKGDVGAGPTSRAGRVLQSRLDSSTMVAVKTAFSCDGGCVGDSRYSNKDNTLPVWR